MTVLGIDIGGTGIKGALVDPQTGALVAPRHRIRTPEKAMPDDVAEVVKEICQHFEYAGPIGVGFPAVIIQGVALSAANVADSWIGTNVNELISQVTGCSTLTLNDADAAGVAEMTFGVGREYNSGVTIFLTVGTGIGSAIFTDGHLVPNTEFGHLQIRGKDAERRASDAARKRKGLTWELWALRFQEYLDTLEFLFSPERFIIGGGVYKYESEFMPLLKTRAQIFPALLQNEAGIIGAAMYAYQKR